MAKKTKSAFRINLEYYPALLGVWVARLIPIRLAYFISSYVFLLYFWFSRKHKGRAVDHILHSGIVQNKAEAVNLARRNFMELGKIAVEIIRLRDMLSPDNIKSRVKFICTEETYKHFVSNPGIIVTGHLGNWELAAITYTISSGTPLLSVMRPMSNPKLEKLFYHRIDNYDHDSCTKQGAIKSMLKALKRGHCVAVVADQHAKSAEGVEVKFFGHPARTHISPALMHLKTGKPIYPLMFRRTKDFMKFELVLREINVKPTDDKEADIKKITQMFTDILEELIRKTPEQWMWMHRRWLNINR